MGALQVTAKIETFPIAGTWTISRGSVTEVEVVTATATMDGATGRGECRPYPRYDEFGEGVVAVVVPDSEGTSAGAIKAALSGQLAKFKQPKQVILLEALPRNTMGKVQKKALREEYAGLFS